MIIYFIAAYYWGFLYALTTPNFGWWKLLVHSLLWPLSLARWIFTGNL